MSNWNYGRVNGTDNGLLDLKHLLNQLGNSNNLNGVNSNGVIGAGAGGAMPSQHRFNGVGNGANMSRAVGTGVIGQGNLSSCSTLGNVVDPPVHNGSSNSYFESFQPVQTFGLFNSKDPSSSLPLNAGVQNFNNQVYNLSAPFNDPGGARGSSSMAAIGQVSSKAGAYHSSSTYHSSSHSPVFGSSHSPTMFGNPSGGNQSQYATGSSNYSSNKFPISTFSLDDTLQTMNDSSSVFGSEETNASASGSNQFGASNYFSNSGVNSHARDRESMTSYNGRSNDHGDTSMYQGARETGIIEKLLHSYGFIQCCERQARLFFHFSQFDGNIEHLKLGDPVEFEMTYDRRTGKPIASVVNKIGPEVQVLSEERVSGTVTTELHHESNGELQGRISYENKGECFFLPYCQDDIEGNVSLCVGDTVSFQIATNQRTGNLTARYVRLENPAQPVRYKGIISSIKDSFGFIERADVAKEIFFHFSETRVQDGIVIGDNVEFIIQTRNGKEVACNIVKLPFGTVIFEDIGDETLKGQILKPIDRVQINSIAGMGPLPRSELMQGRLRYRGPDRQELEVVFGEKDQKGSFTMRHGDWVQFHLAIDRRDKQQRATKITLLEESFRVSGERREQGVIEQVAKDYGYITCAERDSRMFFKSSELLDLDRAIEIGDGAEFTIVQDNTSPMRQAAIRLKLLKPGAVRFDNVVSQNLVGTVMREPSSPWVSQEAVANILPSLQTLGLPPNVTKKIIQGLNSESSGNFSSLEPPKQCDYSHSGNRGMIQYEMTDWQPSTISFDWTQCKDIKNIRTGKKVTFDLVQSRRTREYSAVNIIAAPDDSTRSSSLDGAGQSLHSFNENKSLVASGSIASQADSGIRTLSDASISQGTHDYSDPSAGEDTDSVEEMEGRSKFNEVFCQGDNPNGNLSKKMLGRSESGLNDSNMNSNANSSSQRVLQKGYIAALKDGFGFIETLAQDGEIFFHITSLVGGDFTTLEVGQEVEYTVTCKNNGGKVAADIVKPLPKGSIGRAAVFPNILSGVITRPLRGGANPDQSEYTGLIDANGGENYSFGIISLLNKKDALQSGDSVEFQLDAQGKPVNIRPIRKRIKSTVEAVKGQYGFLAYELEDGKKLFFHMSEVKDHQPLHLGDEVEFVILQNSRNGKCSAGSVVKLVETQRPERLLNRVNKLSIDESTPRIIVVRQPFVPDGSRGFSMNRLPRVPGTLVGSRESSGSSGIGVCK